MRVTTEIGCDLLLRIEEMETIIKKTEQIRIDLTRQIEEQKRTNEQLRSENIDMSIKIMELEEKIRNEKRNQRTGSNSTVDDVVTDSQCIGDGSSEY